MVVALIAMIGWPGTPRPSASARALPSLPFPPSISAPHLGYGLNVRDPSVVGSLFAPLGFEWLKLWEEYGVRDSSLRSE